MEKKKKKRNEKKKRSLSPKKCNHMLRRFRELSRDRGVIPQSVLGVTGIRF